MKTITVIMKPTSECNLRCKYCYHSITNYTPGVMTEEILESIICKVQKEYNDIMYVWHGGEPLLCGVTFFEKAISLQLKYARDPMRIRNSIQTNGTLLTSEVLEFCSKNHISIAVSFDGPGELNCCRQETETVECNLSNALNSGIGVSMLSVINHYNVMHITELYKYAQKKKIPLKMNPVFKIYKEDCADYLLDIKTYINAFQELFDYWLFDSNASSNIEPIMQFVKMYFEKKGSECLYGSCLYKWVSFSHDGSIYPCGRFYQKEYCLGNILELSSVEQAFSSEVYRKMTVSSILRRQQCSENCEYFSICEGGCNSNCILNGDLTSPDVNSCKIFYSCFSYIQNKLDTIRNEPNFKSVNPLILKCFSHYDSIQN